MDDDADTSYTATVILSPLPAKASIFNGVTMKSLIRSIMKDLKLTWKSEKPIYPQPHTYYSKVSLVLLQTMNVGTTHVCPTNSYLPPQHNVCVT